MRIGISKRLCLFTIHAFTIYCASMEIALAVSFLLLLALTFLATVDMAFGQLSDVGLRRLAAEAEEHPKARYAPLLNEILENRSRFSFTLSAAIQILLVAFTVLVTFVSLRWFSRAAVGLIVSLAVTLVLAGIFRQFIPRLISLRNPEVQTSAPAALGRAVLSRAEFRGRALASLVRSDAQG